MPAEYIESYKEPHPINSLMKIMDFMGFNSLIEFRDAMREQELERALKAAGEFGLNNLELPIGPALGVLSPTLRRGWGKKVANAADEIRYPSGFSEFDRARTYAGRPGNKAEILEAEQLRNIFAELGRDIKHKLPKELPDDPRELRAALEQALELGEGKVMTRPVQVGVKMIEPIDEAAIRSEMKDYRHQMWNISDEAEKKYGHYKSVKTLREDPVYNELFNKIQDLREKIRKGEKTVPEKLRIPRIFYHGTPDEFVSEGGWFSEEVLGQNTKAPSAKKGHFVAGRPETAESYTALMTDPEGRVKYFDPQVSQKVLFPIKDKIDMLDIDSKWQLVDDITEGLKKKYEEDFARQRIKYKDPELQESFDKYVERELENVPMRAKAAVENFPYGEDLALSLIAERMAPGSRIYEQPATIPVYVERGKGGTYSYKGQEYREKSYYDTIKKLQKKGADTVLLGQTYDGGPLDDIVVAQRGEQLISALSPGEEGKRKLKATLLDTLLQLEERRVLREKADFELLDSMRKRR